MLDRERPEPIRSEMLDAATGRAVRHGFFTRCGGVSSGLYRGLNVGIGSGDDQGHVRENRARVARWLGVPDDRLVTPYQVHSSEAVVVDAPFAGDRPKADAIVTATPGLAIGVVTADCGPILFADAQAGVIGAAHAGWQGALDGVLEATVDAMIRLGAERARITAVLGPSISQANYEVGPEFVARFRDRDEASLDYFAPSARTGHAMFDLNRFTVDRLAACGVTAGLLDRCTYGEEELFFSYRRTTHRGEPDYGRQISAIVQETA